MFLGFKVIKIVKIAENNNQKTKPSVLLMYVDLKLYAEWVGSKYLDELFNPIILILFQTNYQTFKYSTLSAFQELYE